MKFVCEHCQSKYNIADSRIRNKALKIRCRKCNNIIEIRDPTLPQNIGGKKVGSDQAASAGAKSSRPGVSVLEDRFAKSFKPSQGPKGTPGLYSAVKRSAEALARDEADLVVWFVAIDNKPVGPLSCKSIHRHQRAKRVVDDSLVWKEGMPDWMPLRNCKELVGLLARLDIEQSLSKETPAVDEPRRGLLASAQGAAEPLRGHSVGVVADRIDAPEEPESLPAPDAVGELAAGVQLSAPEAVSPDQLGDGFLSDDLSADMESSLADIQNISLPQFSGSDRWVKVAAVGFFGLAIVVLVVVIFFTGGSGEQEVVEKVVEVVKETVVEKEKIVYRDRPPVVTGERDDSGSNPSGRGSRRGSRGGKGGGSKAVDADKQKLLEQMGLSSPAGDHKLVGGSSADKKAGGTGSGSSALTQQQIRATVNKNRSSLQLCYERSLKQGEAPDDRDVKVLIKFKVGASGMVKTVSIGGAGAKLPGLKGCMERSVKKWVFPTSSGASPVEFPTLFTPR